ncbi:hypothetical protein AVEN_75209-1 [Araneus ventricosus]|uniref:Uncharacterized protein n=1 Tax=Araneus ventricosus TaxID=182803 RepID=A0A4Y2WPW3_ARAVE|nr:hypothetical protein AVEN_75209-1 [Araneus ventricosus]
MEPSGPKAETLPLGHSGQFSLIRKKRPLVSFAHEKQTQVKEAGFEISELLIPLQLIRRLPAEYDHLVQILYRLQNEKFTHLEAEKQALVSETLFCGINQLELSAYRRTWSSS